MEEFESHADLDWSRRSKKAVKIERLLESAHCKFKGQFLEVGVGAGVIASYFSKKYFGFKCTFGVDVQNQLAAKVDFQFQTVEGTNLPFKARQFSLVVSNHVVEHVGGAIEQGEHLREIFRCLEDDGLLYFSVPNKWTLVEPHYRLAFLSWLPQSLASWYLKVFRGKSYYDCRLLSRLQALEMLNNAGFRTQEVTLEAIPLMAEIEGGSFMKIASLFPQWVWRCLQGIIPTYIFICRKAQR